MNVKIAGTHAGISVGDDKVYHGGYDHGSYTCKAGNGHGMEQGVKVPPACHKTHRYAYKYAYDGIRKHRMCPHPYYDIGGRSDYGSGNRPQGICAEKSAECIKPAGQLVYGRCLTSDTIEQSISLSREMFEGKCLMFYIFCL